MFDKFVSFATVKNLTRALIAALFFIVAMNLGATAFYRYTNGVGILDTAGGANLLDNRTGGYSPESAYQMIAAYGAQGIRYHLLLTTADIFFPPTLALFLLLAIAYFYSPIFKSLPLSRWLAGLPIIYLVSDYLENVGIVAMLFSFPSSAPGMARMANFMFMVKNVSSNAAIFVIVIGLVLRRVQSVRGNNEGRISSFRYL